ncbi:DUF5676 family membrane protein [Hyphomicrobium sp.]|uniref:DUF5676 family membrane protein n=1 Tax=Hyphomicrobium sp. TaxID=82 RepID=UPI0025C58916|nr:DUF5676 family membrane protein [Hyphomicrobium sp.]
MSIHQAPARPTDARQGLPIGVFGTSLSIFFAVTYLLCVALRLFVPDVSNHLPWFQFFPGFDWTPFGILLGLIESLAYGWYVALVFGWLFNFFISRCA